MHEAIILEKLGLMIASIDTISTWCKDIETANIFIEDEMRLAAVAMRLQSIGEHIKKIDAKSPGLLDSYDIPVNEMIRFRDFISHHYEGIDNELIFNIVVNELPKLKTQVLLVISNGGKFRQNESGE